MSADKVKRPKIGIYEGNPCIVFFNEDGTESPNARGYFRSLEQCRDVLEGAARNMKRCIEKSGDVQHPLIPHLKSVEDALVEFDDHGPVLLGPEPTEDPASLN